jgi:hypothetical protein
LFFLSGDKSFGAQSLALVLCHYVADITRGTPISKKHLVASFLIKETLKIMEEIASKQWPMVAAGFSDEE